MRNYAVLGRNLPHTLSPQLHSAIYEITGIDASYGVFEVEPDKLCDVLPAAKILGIDGFNVTIPYKRDIIKLLDNIDPKAAELGAVNTVKLENGLATGYNTDYYGFPASLLHAGIEIAGKSFLLCGVSGAGMAIKTALLDGGAVEVLFASTDPKKGITYAELAGFKPMDVIVNCTPVGMYPDIDACVVEDAVFANFKTAVDIIYNPIDTLFLKKAREHGLKTLSGLYMLVFQGMKSFEIWTGINLESGVADKVYERLCKLL